MIKPIKKRVLVQITKPENKSGLIIPEDKKDKKLERAKIIACGDQVDPILTNATHVYMGKFTGTPINMNGEEYLILKEEEIEGYE